MQPACRLTCKLPLLLAGAALATLGLAGVTADAHPAPAVITHTGAHGVPSLGRRSCATKAHRDSARKACRARAWSRSNPSRHKTVFHRHVRSATHVSRLALGSGTESSLSPGAPEQSPSAPSLSGPPSGSVSTPPQTGSSPALFFARASVWNQPLSSNAPLEPDSAALVGSLAAEAGHEAARGVGPWIATSNYSTPIYVVGPHQPLVYVALEDNTLSWRVTLQSAFAAVPIPENAQPAAGTDAQMTIYQPSTDRLWEFWRASKRADGWHASWGGAIDGQSQSPGYYATSSWAGSAPNWGASASSLPLVAGTMMIGELRSGHVDHALAMEVPFPRAGVYAWPAQRTDGLGTVPTDLPEGARLRLDPRLDIPALHLPRFVEIMALAAQRYGIIVRDQSHHYIGFYGEDPTPTGTDPYHGLHGIYEGQWPSQLLARFPWSSLEVLKMSLHSYPG
jgi:hypothetical protein